jgi:hypothetical protein
MNADEARQVQKSLDTLEVVERHFSHEAKMNAALHMAAEVRPAPLAVAVENAVVTLSGLRLDCGCLHPPHPGLVCGRPLHYAEKDGEIIHGAICGCEG